jgi:hypothetical protein
MTCELTGVRVEFSMLEENFLKCCQTSDHWGDSAVGPGKDPDSLHRREVSK